MPTLNKDRIFNESATKVLLREYENLKKDYTKNNAISYKMLYENKSLSFILENSRYIFSEPIRGYDFYKSVIESATLPFHKITDECNKVEEYFSENEAQMSEKQKELYINLLNVITEKKNNVQNSINLYTSMMENCDAMLPYYDALYEYIRTDKASDVAILNELISEREDVNIMDAVNLTVGLPEFSSSLFSYLESVYVESPSDADDYLLNSYTTNVLRRMMADKAISEQVETISNMNLRHFIKGLAGVTGTDMIETATLETAVNYDPVYSSGVNSVNRIFDDQEYYESFKDKYDEEKANRLLCEKAVVDMELAFMLLEEQASDIDAETKPSRIVEQICIESTTIEKIPQTIIGNIKLLAEKSESLKDEILSICESYFTADGSASKVISHSVGDVGEDDRLSKNKKTDDYYTPYHRDDKSENENNKDEDDADAKKREEAKRRKTEKYSKMNIDDSVLDSISESDDSDRIMPPEKKNIFQRIQNKALDMNVKFKKKVANSRRKSVDAKNAGKAVTKIPMNIADSVKKSVDEWDEMDDNRRKEYIIKPGFRKKYFRALRLCIMHYGAFAVNPVLNIVLAICQKASHTKNIRIRNELIRELKAEIKVTEEKIEDAKSNGDNKQKYKLMRIKEKLEAEVARVGSNSKFV